MHPHTNEPYPQLHHKIKMAVVGGTLYREMMVHYDNVYKATGEGYILTSSIIEHITLVCFCQVPGTLISHTATII